ncbi:MAG: AAA domain-containing protein, partial [Candidatus Babeliales bacterium]
QLLKELRQYEHDGSLSLPVTNLDIFIKIWREIKSRLRLKDVNFNEESFLLEDIKISLNTRANFFLADDLTQLAKLSEEDLTKSALTSWMNIDNNELNVNCDAPHEKDLYFPFPYDKYQLSTLSILGNKAAIIQGPPGTGKSETISNILCHLAATGKRVLFVSQKAQALKVVKDKLKKLNIKYLFGYIPNPASAQIGEDDENDGIGPQLSALEAFVEKIKYQIDKKPLVEIVEKKVKYQTFFNENIENQQKYYSLHSELLRLSKYEINILNIELFIKNFSSDLFQEIKKLYEDIRILKNAAKKYETSANSKNHKLETIFDGLNISNRYSTAILRFGEEFDKEKHNINIVQKNISELSNKITEYGLSENKRKLDEIFVSVKLDEISYTCELENIKNDLAITAYDGHNNLVRKFNNLKRNLRLKSSFAHIPREVRDYINSFISKDVSRAQVKSFMDSILEYFYSFDDKRELDQKKFIILSSLDSLLNLFVSDLDPKINCYLRENLYKFDITEEQVKTCLLKLINYLVYCENIYEISLAERKINELLDFCGLSDESFKLIDRVIQKAGTSNFLEEKKNILRVQEIKIDIQNNYANLGCANNIKANLQSVEQERIQRISLYIQNIINTRLIKKFALGLSIRQAVRKFASAFKKSKKAFKTFANLRKDPHLFKEILDMVPVWIMELDDASRIIPLEAESFDYVILDEASQCNVAYALPAMYRAQRVLFVGDSEQMRDSTVMFKSNRVFDELASRYNIPEEKQIKSTGSAVQSVLNIAYKQGLMSKTLCYHYRSPAELIGFSNQNFYKPKGKDLVAINNNYLTYKDTNRVMLIHEVKSDWHKEFKDNVNVDEANAILELFKELREDKLYKDKSIGILSFFNDQATYMRKLFEDSGFDEMHDNYKISIIDGIQGDEKDIIIYSFVIRSPAQKNIYVPLTGESGDIRADVNSGRVNVAFSRARLQVHCFISLPLQEMPENIWIKKYLEYVQDNGKVKFCSTELKPFDSYFEELFFNLICTKLKQDYKIQNQVESCGFKIDFVISNTKTGKRLAIECDGPCHYKDEIDEAYGIHIESDEERQRILEAAGWKFFRIRYSDWIDEKFDRNALVNVITDLLK